mmetsp:Transcript_388/g.1306  ORF Transcript_388/g.1306 Transcript_388/m.1306 type:complete len:270 (+) Transcript_388:105-914(+)|eukprot:CAMPEP_0198729092 /NCGR_PEP_ID=MMETSP1475-20131203/14785_1 /TAXON_ID= ORGANISM="Unidentified sp., Strain CCMP1999" /NCGR_SAMPLE_ID=MMETSP1475 /ASSEMBLY_ACC=CAM_ASM_001111 /LENGTH=269 /DNA_ID=CAMNT_0044491659 /DNA_START=60 /DNA_END=869 /DNA_ORIENTATION=+
MDRDWGAKTGGGGVASKDHTNIARRERLRQLALDTIDLAKDPYLMRNHLGSYECKLCLTLHNNEGNYLAHTQGRKHQNNLARRAAREAREAPVAAPMSIRKIQPKKSVKIGRPGYRITKQRDPDTKQLSLLFNIEYPEIIEGLQPRYRFMSTFEQRKEAADKDWQYLLFAAEPYETIAFKIPNWEVDKNEDKFFNQWDADKLVFTLQLFFKTKKQREEAKAKNAAPSRQAQINAGIVNEQQQDQAEMLPPPPLQNPQGSYNPFAGIAPI